MTEHIDALDRTHRSNLRQLLSAEDPAAGTRSYPSHQQAAIVRSIVSIPARPATLEAVRPRHRRQRYVVAAGVAGALALGGVTAVAGLRPAGEVATAPMAPPIILNGVGTDTVPLPPAPHGATYLRLELTCFGGTRCETPGGFVTSDSPKGPLYQRDALPLTATVDPTNAQQLAPLNPASGLPVTVTAGTRWRLYAVYTDSLNPVVAPLHDGRTLGIPNNLEWPDLVPAVATNGRTGWIDRRQLIESAKPQLPVYDQDGSTVLGTADLSRSAP